MLSSVYVFVYVKITICNVSAWSYLFPYKHNRKSGFQFIFCQVDLIWLFSLFWPTRISHLSQFKSEQNFTSYVNHAVYKHVQHEYKFTY